MNDFFLWKQKQVKYSVHMQVRRFHFAYTSKYLSAYCER